FGKAETPAQSPGAQPATSRRPSGSRPLNPRETAWAVLWCTRHGAHLSHPVRREAWVTRLKKAFPPAWALAFVFCFALGFSRGLEQRHKVPDCPALRYFLAHVRPVRAPWNPAQLCLGIQHRGKTIVAWAPLEQRVRFGSDSDSIRIARIK